MCYCLGGIRWVCLGYQIVAEVSYKTANVYWGTAALVQFAVDGAIDLIHSFRSNLTGGLTSSVAVYLTWCGFTIIIGGCAVVWTKCVDPIAGKLIDPNPGKT